VATLTPGFREILPPWLARQPWYAGTGVPVLRPVGTFRLEDPAGEVGMETHLITDGSAVYQLPMTYRGAPLADGALIATAEHSELGQRWIYDAESDPVWRAGLLRLVRDGGEAGTGEVRVRGVPLSPMPDPATIELIRMLAAGDAEVPGMVVGTWQPSVTGPLAVIRAG
jgi:Maltokinase N-terminal cap domain